MKTNCIKTSFNVMLVVLFTIIMFSGCEWDSKITSFEIETLPNKTEYQLGRDEKIDMTGAVIVGIKRSGKKSEIRIKTFKQWTEYDENDVGPIAYWDDAEVNWKTKGKYPIYIRVKGSEQIQTSFFITVTETAYGLLHTHPNYGLLDDEFSVQDLWLVTGQYPFIKLEMVCIAPYGGNLDDLVFFFSGDPIPDYIDINRLTKGPDYWGWLF